MVQLLKIKEQIYQFVGRFEIYVMAAIRFVIAFVAFYLINSTTGYMKFLTDYPIALILALLSSFLPAGMMMFFSAALILIQFYALSRELCLVTALIFIVLFCVYLRFSTRKGLYAMLTPLTGIIGVPYALPVASGLLSEPYTVISVVCGEVVYFLLKHVRNSSAMFSSVNNTSAKSILTLAASEILMDKEMYLYLIAFVAAAIVVYCVRKLSVDHAHVIAIVIGIVLQLGAISAGEIWLGNTAALVQIIIGCVVSLLISLIVNFMTRSLDYSRVEHVQFEDDEYYYYVKAVPKAFVPVQDKQVKQINTKRTRTKKASKNKKTKSGSAEQKQETLEEQLIREFREDDE